MLLIIHLFPVVLCVRLVTYLQAEVHSSPPANNMAVFGAFSIVERWQVLVRGFPKIGGTILGLFKKG